MTDDTRTRLLDAAEHLFAAKGLHATSMRELVAAAGQRNESAIQYHFGGRDGLIDALHARRLGQLQITRMALLDEMSVGGAPLEVSDLVRAAAAPVAAACRQDDGFRDYLRVFGQLALAPDKLLTGNAHEVPSVERIGAALRDQLDLPSAVADLRLDTLARFVALHMCQWARSEHAFRGPEFELFFENMLDMATAMLTAPVSAATGAVLEAPTGAVRGRRSVS